MAKQNEQVAHPELVGGGQTALHSHAGGGGLAYTQKDVAFTCPMVGQWYVQSLLAFGVPANAVCEVLLVNKTANAELMLGLRATGTSLSRNVLLHEAEAGGNSYATMHVVADADSEVAIYKGADEAHEFYLVGYWS